MLWQLSIKVVTGLVGSKIRPRPRSVDLVIMTCDDSDDILEFWSPKDSCSSRLKLARTFSRIEGPLSYDKEDKLAEDKAKQAKGSK